MGKTTIEWTANRRPDGTLIPGFTFNPWRGCTKVSAGCKHCYAETLSKRNPSVLGIWGPNGTRVPAAESYWRQPLIWNANARSEGVRRRVFCASLADVFEDRVELHPHRLRLLRLIHDTPDLDWLLLTKRPENIVPALATAFDWACAEMLEKVFANDPTDDCEGFRDWLNAWIEGNPPANVWLGTSVENQEAANERIPHLLACPAAVRFLSCEPLLGPVDLKQWVTPVEWRRWIGRCVDCGHTAEAGQFFGTDYWGEADEYPCPKCGSENEPVEVGKIHWVIVGGESGPKARPMHPDWARSLRDQCQTAGVAFFFKQHGEYLHEDQVPEQEAWEALMASGSHHKWEDGVSVKVGKKAAGRLLDGRTWDELPTAIGKEVAHA